MAKGLNLVELREQLEGDAQKRCAAQEATIKELFAQIKAKDGQIAALTERNKKLEAENESWVKYFEKKGSK